jgi:SAM-dependent methyltransferase
VSTEPPRGREDFEAGWRGRFTDYGQTHDDDAGIAGWSPTVLAAGFRFFQYNWQPSDSGALWLDVGCGAGTYARYLEQQGPHVIGVDYSLPSLTKAAVRAPSDIHWVAADARVLPLPSACLAGALCFGVTQALADSRALMDELGRVTGPGGEIWIDGLNGWCLPHLLHRIRRCILRQPPHLRYESPMRLRRLAREAGFRDVRVRWLPILPGRFHRFQGWLEKSWVVAVLHRLSPIGILLSHSVVIRARRP